jgi:hypothetical protein
MKIKLRIILIGILAFFVSERYVVAGSDSTSSPRIKWGGFVKAESMFDTRQIVEAREGYLLLYPKKVKPDANGDDINASPQFNQYAMIARLSASVTGPDVLGAKSVALLEGDFTGASNSDNNSFRLRHAYLKLQWKNSTLLAGQYWHAINIPEMIPNVLSLNTGAPFHPFSRQPQIRYDYEYKHFKWVAALSSQRDYANNGPVGISSIYLRQSALPNVHSQIQYKKKWFFGGFGFDFKRLTPVIETSTMLKTNSHVDAFSFTSFAMIKTKPVTIKAQAIYGQALDDHLLIGGYAIKSMDSLTGIKNYTPLQLATYWLSVQTNGKNWQVSMFAGYCKNMGAKYEITETSYGRDTDIDYAWRVAPMISYKQKHLTIAAETELTTALYGKPDKKFRINGDKPVSNTRISISIGYTF